MWRIRLLRILIPALLVPFVVLLVLELRPRRTAAPDPPEAQGDPPRVVARDVEVLSLEGARRLFDLKADRYLEPAEGHQKVEGVERLDLFRDDSSPLRIRADLADIRGEAPNRIAIVRGGLDVRDDEAGMELSLPTLEIHEGRREARSLGDVRFVAPGYTGRAAEVVYPLDDRPTRFADLELASDRGDRMSAKTALLLPGSDEIRLSDDVRFESGTTWIESPSMIVRRDPDEGWVREVEADLGVRGGDEGTGGPPAAFRAHRLEAAWSARGEVRRVALLGDAAMQQGDRVLIAAEVVASLAGTDWRVRAQGGVVARGRVGETDGTLRATVVDAVVAADGAIRSGTASGAVRFESADAFASADRAELSTEGGIREVVWSAGDDAKARLAQADRRVAAESIRLRPGTSWMHAEGRAEATLLPGTAQDPAAGTAMFRGDEAVHFVARAIRSDPSGDALSLDGGVRGWQGERNLSADRIEFDRRSSSLAARGSVATRVPLREGQGLSAGDYLHVTAGALDYVEAERTAVFVGEVRAKQETGWLDAARLEVDLDADGSGVRRMTGMGDVEFEYRSRDERGMPRPVTGRGDRVVYEPADGIVRLYGDERPATVRSPGPGGGVTEGRVIRYGLMDGSIEVEGYGRIRTGTRDDD